MLKIKAAQFNYLAMSFNFKQTKLQTNRIFYQILILEQTCSILDNNQFYQKRKHRDGNYFDILIRHIDTLLYQ